MELLFVRHGITDWNQQGRMQGGVDTKLNTLGIEHAKQMAKDLQNTEIDIAFCSPLARAKQTMDIINKNRKSKIPVIMEDALAERDYGFHEGQNKKDFNYDLVWDYSDQLSIENFFDFAWPIINFIFKDLLQKYKNKRILIVSHGGVSKVFEMILSKNSLHPREMADYLPGNSEILKYKNTGASDFVFNVKDNIYDRTYKSLFTILTPNIVSLYFPGVNLNDLIDVDAISKIPKIRYRASVIYTRKDGGIAAEIYKKTKECKLPARTIDPKRRILNQVREILLQMTGYLGDVSEFKDEGIIVEIRPSDPIAEIVCT